MSLMIRLGKIILLTYTDIYITWKVTLCAVNAMSGGIELNGTTFMDKNLFNIGCMRLET
jgi:hypothetical protein